MSVSLLLDFLFCDFINFPKVGFLGLSKHLGHFIPSLFILNSKLRVSGTGLPLLKFFIACVISLDSK
jgi:hypothetical protein